MIIWGIISFFAHTINHLAPLIVTEITKIRKIIVPLPRHSEKRSKWKKYTYF